MILLRLATPRAAKKVRDFGERNGVEKLVQSFWPEASPEDGWEMAAVTTSLNKCDGAYRCPDDNGFSWVVLRDIRWATH